MQTIALKMFLLLTEKWWTANKTSGGSQSTAQNIAQYVQGALENNNLISKYISIACNKTVIQYLQGLHGPPQIMFMHN